MMQDLRAHYDIDAVVGEGKSERVPAHGVVVATTIALDEHTRDVEADRSQCHAARGSGSAGGSGDVGCSGSNVEQHRTFRQLSEHRLELGQCCTYTAKKKIRSLDVGHGTRHDL